MEKFYFEVPSIKRKEDALDFIHEFIEYNSDINGSGGFNRYINDYEGWLEKLERDYISPINEKHVPSRTYFLVRLSDRRIVGTINIRLALNEKLRRYGGHIGYSIRPTERGKGYNNINLYLGLKVLYKYGVDKALLDADLNNPASWKTMERFGGKRIREYFNEEEKSILVDYEIDIKKGLEANSAFEGAVLNIQDFQIRKKKREDCAGVDHVVSVAWNETYKGLLSDEYLASIVINEQERAEKSYINFNKSDNHQYVLEIDNKIVGFINVGLSDKTNIGEIFALYIIEPYKGFGFGKKLIEAGIKELKSMNCNQMIIGCLKGNPSNTFYSHLGGKPIGERKIERLNSVETIYFFDKI